MNTISMSQMELSKKKQCIHSSITVYSFLHGIERSGQLAYISFQYNKQKKVCPQLCHCYKASMCVCLKVCTYQSSEIETVFYAMN